jgi:hypothetical protein
MLQPLHSVLVSMLGDIKGTPKTLYPTSECKSVNEKLKHTLDLKVEEKVFVVRSDVLILPAAAAARGHMVCMTLDASAVSPHMHTSPPSTRLRSWASVILRRGSAL